MKSVQIVGFFLPWNLCILPFQKGMGRFKGT